MVTAINYAMPSRCGCGSPLAWQDQQPWCGTCGFFRLAQFDKAKHPRGADGRFGNGGDDVPAKPPSAADTDHTIQRAMHFLTKDEQDNLPRVVLATKKPGGNIEVGAFVVPGYPVIYIATWSATWNGATMGDKDSEMELASILVHETTHVNGGGEKDAYAAQIKALRRMGASELLVDKVSEERRKSDRNGKR